MPKSFERLERVLQLEVRQGYKDKAVVGGIRQFAIYWTAQAEQDGIDELDTFFIEQTSDTLTHYGKLPGREARKKAIDAILNQLANRKKRHPEATSQTTSRPRPTRKAQPSAKTRPPERKPRVAQKTQARPTPAQKSQRQQEPKRQPAKKAAPHHPPEAQKPAPFIISSPDPEGLNQPTTTLKGVGPKISQLLAKLGAETVADLLHVYPRRYDDYTQLLPIQRLKPGEVVTIIGTIWQTRTRRSRNNQIIVHSIISDGTGKITATWFNQKWLADKLKAGMQIVISGKVEQYLGKPIFNNPEWEPLSAEQLRTNRIVPIYPLTKGLGSNKMRQLMRKSVNYWAARVAEPLPHAIRKRRQLMGLQKAIQQIHFPDSQKNIAQARKRLAFDELLMLQLGMLGKRHEWQKQPAAPISTDEAQLQALIDSLPYTLTGAQTRVIEEIKADMNRPMPMNRLLQGDVGAGKTIVAAAAMVMTVSAGYQAALMAPTGILAEQHFNGLSELLQPLGIEIRLLTGRTSAADKKRIYAECEAGEAQLTIGTHALIQKDVRFKQLGLVVIDEQHRFGVDQRGELRSKNIGDMAPHLLAMSATPIPRTLALSMYGDLDLSVLDEMPPGRQEIKTRWLRSAERERAYAFTRRQIQAGRQAFFIFPLVEESDKLDLKAAVDEHTRLQKEIYPTLKLGLIHGRMKATEKETVMREFAAGELDILVATTVIEVGIDVPNSTVIVIEGANRFGLAQLHQLRGRVGRGQHQSYCMLISDPSSQVSAERLTALEDTNDGFQLAEKDLELRGPGQFFGRQQSGVPELKMASIFDVDLLNATRDEANILFESDPTLEKEEHAQLHQQVSHFWANAGDIS